MTPPISRRDFLRSTAVLGAGVALLPRIGHATEPAGDGTWLVGDLHCHTVFSHDVWGGPTDDNTGLDEAYTLGWTPGQQITIAELRGLDFLAITDHNDVRALTDPGYASNKLALIKGYEHSLSKGHAGCLGITDVLEFDTSTDAGAIALRDEVHARGGTFILNHPFYADGWRYSPAVVPDSIEVWNIGWVYRHIAPELVDNIPPEPSVSDNYKSLPYWETEFLSKGRMPATGGSDNHYRATTAAQGVGQPATWVYARDRSPEAILEGIRAGRTFVAAEPPLLGGITIDLTARSGESSWMVGDDVPASAGQVTVSARVTNAPGHRIVFVVDGVRGELQLILSLDKTFEITLDAAAHNRVRVEVFLDQGYWMGALTSPIYFA
jgi:TAT (twin-arginine translocation) pathway-exported protein/PHP domain-containing protein